MTLTIIIGIAGLLALAAAATGVVVDKDGKPSILIKSKWIRVVVGVSAVFLIALSFYMWNVELLNKEGDCKGCNKKIEVLNGKIETLKKEISITQNNLNISIGNVYEDSSNFLFRVAMMIGRKSKLGCTLEIKQYQEIQKFSLSDPDMCKSLKLLMHPVTITAANGINEAELSKSLFVNGISSFIVPKERRTNARSEHLAIFYPDGVSKEVVCTVRSLYETSFKKSNRSSKDIAIKYALNMTKIGSVQKGLIVISNQAIQLGVDPRQYVSQLKKITIDEWNDICSKTYSPEDFEAFIEEKSSNISLPKASGNNKDKALTSNIHL